MVSRALTVAYAYFDLWEPAQEARARAREVARLRSGTDLRYWNIKLGMSKAAVRCLKGDPTATDDTTTDWGESWSYTARVLGT
jgi:hypothetical protein